MSPPTRRISRRALLASVGASAALLPLLRPTRSLGDPPAFPRRLVVVFSPNGTLPDWFWPTDPVATDHGPGIATLAAPLPEITAPLEAYKRSLLFVRGLSIESHKFDQGMYQTDGAHSALASLLTGVPAVVTAPAMGATGYGIAGASSPSLDQHVAVAIAARTALRYRSLTLGVIPTANNPAQSRISWLGRLQPVTPETDPYRLFADMFSAGRLDPAAIARRHRERGSVLDGTARDLASLRARLGGVDDQNRIDAHLDAVRQLELQLTAEAGAGACAQPTLVGRYDPGDYAHYDGLGRAQMDLLATALTCDLTRVATLQWSDGSGLNTVFPFLPGFASTACPASSGVCPDQSAIGGQLGHHAVSHACGDGHPEHNTDPGAMASVAQFAPLKRQCEAWYAQQFAYLLGKLAAVPEGSGTLLDNTAVLWLSNMELGGAHNMDNVPFVLAGGCGGRIRPGRYVRYADSLPINRMLASLLAAFDVDATGFGTTQFDSRPLTELAG